MNKNNSPTSGAFKFFCAVAISISIIGVTDQVWTISSASASASCTAGSFTTDSSQSPVVTVTFSAPASGDASCTWTVPDDVYSVDYLVVGGGGGGASGGGGAGGVATSWSTRIGANAANRTTPLSVTPGDAISVTVGAGGQGGAGGSARYYGTAGTLHQTIPANGNGSSFGSIVATGGGAGGHRRSNFTGVLSGDGQAGGSSGGASYDRNNNAVTSAVASTAVGARSYGNSGGASLAGSYSAGGGGGGAGGSGGNTRTLSANCNAEGCSGSTWYYHGGGNGGAGIESNITGSWVTYSCGGGGGVNSNTAKIVTSGGGSAGCASSGKGSSYSAYAADYNTSSLPNSVTFSQWQAAIGTAAAAGFGGGGGGTDPEDYRGQSGGSGVVILRYTVVDADCPNIENQERGTPLACPAEVTVQADGISVDTTLLTGPISFSSSGAYLTIVSSPTANPTSGNLSASIVDSTKLRVSVPSNSSLIGGTYPVIYRITSSGGASSESYLLVTVEDPSQLTPFRLAVDPRLPSIGLPSFPLGDAANILLCITESEGDGYATAANVTAPSRSGVTAQSRNRGTSWSGTRSNLQPLIEQISLESPESGSALILGNSPRVFDVNVTNTSNGGNNSCTGGTESQITIDPLGISFRNSFLLLVND